MKLSYFKPLFAVTALILCLAALMPAALAADDLAVNLKAQITLEGTQPTEAETFVIRMTADNSAFPMPGGQTGGTADLNITGAAVGTFPTITYSNLGIYTYTIQQLPGTNADCTYDDRTYQMKVVVTNAEQGEGLDIAVTLHESGKTEKLDAVCFHNVYETIVTPPGEITATGVNDMWFYYVGGSALLLIIAGIVICNLRPKKDGNNDGEK